MWPSICPPTGHPSWRRILLLWVCWLGSKWGGKDRHFWPCVHWATHLCPSGPLSPSYPSVPSTPIHSVPPGHSTICTCIVPTYSPPQHHLSTSCTIPPVCAIPNCSLPASPSSSFHHMQTWTGMHPVFVFAFAYECSAPNHALAALTCPPPCTQTHGCTHDETLTHDMVQEPEATYIHRTVFFRFLGPLLLSHKPLSCPVSIQWWSKT